MRMTLILLAMLYASLVYAQPYAVLEDKGTVVTLNDDPCKLEFLSGDYHTATWREKEKVYNGCWGINSLGIVVIWTDDKAMSAIPGQHFKRVEGI